MAPLLMIEVLAQEVGSRNVTVNSIDPTVVEGAGVFTEVVSNEEFQAANRAMRPSSGAVQDGPTMSLTPSSTS